MIYLNRKSSAPVSKKRLLTTFFQPDVCVSSLNEIDLLRLKAFKIKSIICDLDNTLVPHYKILPDRLALKFLNDCKKYQFNLVIMSNNREERVKKFATFAKIDRYVSTTWKPLTFKVKKAIKKYHINLNETIIIGDQIITDILLANFLNIKSILVTPVVNVDYKVNFITKMLEEKIYARLQRNNLIVKKKQSYLFIGDENNFL